MSTILNPDYPNFPDIFDGIDPAVTSGLEVFALLGGSLSASLKNYAAGGAALVKTGSPAVSSTGAAVNSTNYITGPLQDSSETIFIVASYNHSAGDVSVFSTSPTGPYQSGTAMGHGGDFTYLSLYAALSSGSPLLQIAPDNSTGTLAILATPQLYRLKIDIPNLLVSAQNMTTTAWHASAAMASGTTRPSNSTPYTLGGQHAGVATPVNVSAWLKYNRATTSDEDAAIYSQLQALMAEQGVTI